MPSNNKTEIIAKDGKQELYIIREFDAPRELVFRAFTEKDLIAKWMGPKNLTAHYEKFEPVSGGAYRYTHTDPNGNSYSFNGTFHEVCAPERIIQTFEFEGLPERGHVALDGVFFEALHNNRTRVTTQSVFMSVEDRDGMIAAGMEHGVNEGYESLATLLDELLQTS